MPDLARERLDYHSAPLREEQAPADPYLLFDDWLAAAFAAKERGELPEPTAMVLATSLGDRPSARTVLLKGVEDGSFVFYSNYDSAKGHELAREPVRGPALRVVPAAAPGARRGPGDAGAAGRVRGLLRHPPEWLRSSARGPRRSRTRWRASRSWPRRTRGSSAASRVEEVPCPPHWGGFRVRPSMIEFWQGQPSRMHDRLRYDRTGDAWTRARLAP